MLVFWVFFHVCQQPLCHSFTMNSQKECYWSFIAERKRRRTDHVLVSHTVPKLPPSFFSIHQGSAQRPCQEQQGAWGTDRVGQLYRAERGRRKITQHCSLTKDSESNIEKERVYLWWTWGDHGGYARRNRGLLRAGA